MARKPKSIRERGDYRWRAGQNPLRPKARPIRHAMDALADVYEFLERRKHYLPENDYHNRVKIKGIQAAVETAYELFRELKQDLKPQGTDLRDKRRKVKRWKNLGIVLP